MKYFLIKKDGTKLQRKDGQPFEYSLKRLAYQGRRYLQAQNGEQYEVKEEEQ